MLRLKSLALSHIFSDFHWAEGLSEVFAFSIWFCFASICHIMLDLTEYMGFALSPYSYFFILIFDFLCICILYLHWSVFPSCWFVLSVRWDLWEPVLDGDTQGDSGHFRLSLVQLRSADQQCNATSYIFLPSLFGFLAFALQAFLGVYRLKRASLSSKLLNQECKCNILGKTVLLKYECCCCDSSDARLLFQIWRKNSSLLVNASERSQGPPHPAPTPPHTGPPTHQVA